MPEARQAELREIARIVIEEQSAFLAAQQDRIVDAAVAASLAAWGVDAKDENELREIKLDRIHNRRWRKSVETAQRVTFVTAISTVITGIVGFLLMMVRAKTGS